MHTQKMGFGEARRILRRSSTGRYDRNAKRRICGLRSTVWEQRHRLLSNFLRALKTIQGQWREVELPLNPAGIHGDLVGRSFLPCPGRT